MSFENWLYLVLLIVFLGMAGWFASAEIAFISMQKLRIEHLVRTGDKRAKVVDRIMEKPGRFLATVLIGINLFETAAATLATILAVAWGGEQLGAAISIIVVTLLTLVLAEFIPKNTATRFGERMALSYARPVEIVSAIFYPLAWVLDRIGLGITNLGEPTEPKPTISEAEFRTALTVGSEEGTVEKEAVAICQRVFDFGDRQVREVMVPRTEVISIEKSALVGDLLALFQQHPLSRFPVYRENTDNLMGIVSIKDVLMALAGGNINKNSPIDILVRPAYFVPETKLISELFAEMRDKNTHLAVVVDEYGGLAGIISLSQLVEEIVGPIGDELAAIEKEYEEVGENSFSIDGSMRLEDANEQMGLNLPAGSYETVAGFILHLLGHIPREGETVRYAGLKIVIDEMKGMKIEKVTITREKHAAITD